MIDMQERNIELEIAIKKMAQKMGRMDIYENYMRGRSNYDKNVEAKIREKTDELYKWEDRAKEESEKTGKQYQIPLRENLHMDIPGMETFIMGGASMLFLPIVAMAPKMMARKMTKEKK
jgi:hypothetical protein